ncbi:MAG: hypothetical protein KAT66_02370 [Candidatus Lokiarchaeota archaeon]|nr:hypothetical protein [Candidatus Lokiarchaeota archaeon]
MITTRESINYQFSLIFGYSSPNDIIVGDVIGPGKLTRERVNELSQEVIKFLRMYNAILRDYTGSEVFSIEFELYNLDEKSARINIYPKSMIFIPGKYKDCESLLLALKPETGYLDIHKSRESINNISKLFFEVEEFTDRPELKSDDKQQVYKRFATRFSKKLFGELIEDKWNKKLIGLSASLPTEKEMLNTYARVKSDVDILLHKRPYEINLFNSKFERLKSPFEGQQSIEHIKYSISEPSANFIVDKTLKLGANLINLANTGTIDESQDRVILFIINYIKQKTHNLKDPCTAKSLISFINRILIDLERYLNKFIEYSNSFLTTGEIGDLPELLKKYKQFIVNKAKFENEDFEDICNLAIKSIDQSATTQANLRAIDLSSIFNYFSEIIKNSLNLVKTFLPKYLSRRRLKSLIIELIKNLKQKFENEQKPAKILGQKLIEKFKDHIFNQIEINPMVLSGILKFNEENIIKEFRRLINTNIEPFFNNIKLDMGDLVSFAEIQMDKDINIIREHIEKFKTFSSELSYLLSYVLRYTTINRYIKEEPDKEIADPVTFATRFHRFLEKRMGGINLTWKSYILEWINDYTKKFFKLEERKEWTLDEIYNDFISYFEERESNEQKLEHFLKFLDTYIARISNIEEKNLLIEFYKQYDLSINISTEFPKYVNNNIKQGINILNPQFEEQVPINFFNLNGEDHFYDYIKELELKYFSKLIPRPLTLILKHNLTSEEKELFGGDLFHVLSFKFWHTNSRFELADNFKEVYREWLKEL